MHPPQLNQRGLVLFVIHLESSSVCFVYDRFHYGINDAACIQSDLDAVAHFVLAFGLRHAKECTTAANYSGGDGPLTI